MANTKRRYSPMANDMHFVLDMSLRTRYVLRTSFHSALHIAFLRDEGGPHSGGRSTRNLKTHSPSPDSVRSSLPDGALLSFLVPSSSRSDFIQVLLGFHPNGISSALVDFIPFAFRINFAFRASHFTLKKARLCVELFVILANYSLLF